MNKSSEWFLDSPEAARFKSLVTMYENMKRRDAAKIFDRLDNGVLLEVASKIDPRHMADIIAAREGGSGRGSLVSFPIPSRNPDAQTS